MKKLLYSECIFLMTTNKQIVTLKKCYLGAKLVMGTSRMRRGILNFVTVILCVLFFLLNQVQVLRPPLHRVAQPTAGVVSSRGARAYAECGVGGQVG